MDEFILVLFMEDNLNVHLVEDMVQHLVDPLPLFDTEERHPKPRNENYFEIIIPRYSDIQFFEHFRITREQCEELVHIVGNHLENADNMAPLRKKLLFSVWLLSNQESFLATSDRFGFAVSTGHAIFKQIVMAIAGLLPHYIKWPNQENYNTIASSFQRRSRGFPCKQPIRNEIDNYNRKGFHSIILQGDICDVSCCTRETERELYKYNQQSLNRYLKNSISKVGNIIETRAKKFDDCFREMMNSSKMEFHEMFERTYGKIYLKNSDVFSDFFHELEIYYKKGTIRLSESMDTFFGILYQRMFTVINAQYTFDDKYLTCVAENMPEMKPFGDVPKKLGMQLRRSFVATRTFFKSLIRGVEVANKMTTLNIENDCYRESMKMRFCGICRGETHSGPCSNYCTNTTKYCLAHHSELSTHWDNFVDAIDKVGDRLLGPYNIEQVVEPLNIKISEAIMTFQDSGANVSKKIYTKCGKPTFNRSRRKAEYKNSSEDNPNMEIKTEPMKMPGKKKHKKVEQIERSTLEKIILDIKQKIKETKQFWLQLPYQFCNNLSLSFNITDRDECYNGTMGIDGDEYAKNIAGTSAIVNEQLYILTDLTDKLKKAYQGQEVEMVDDTEEILAGSGSGSGDFSIETTEYEPKVRIHEEEEEEFFTTVLSPSSTRAPEVGRPASTASTTTMSLTRALLQYILPMVLVWFGGAITNLL